MPAPDQQTLLAYCRAGFEGDLAAELMERAADAGMAGYCRAADGSAHVLLHLVDGDAAALQARVPWSGLVFARQWTRQVARVDDLPQADRVTPLVNAVTAALTGVNGVRLEYPDTNDGKALSRFCRRFAAPLEHGLKAAGVRTTVSGAPRLHLFFTDSASARIAVSDPSNSAPWPLGIPRLRMPRDAPSRSTLKLDEALQTFLDEDQRGQWLRAGMTAVDLGAAPGGWSWQLARRGLHVTAVDNGPMEPSVLADGFVTHVRADGFRFRPRRPVDWLVCDIVEQPSRVVRLIGQWLARGDCAAAVFNLKLPMKRRHEAVREALEQIAAGLDTPRRVRAKQLYHDREEVTLFVSPPV